MRINLSESILGSIKESDDEKFRRALSGRLKLDKLHEDAVYNHQGERCPKCGSGNYYEVDGAEFDDGTQEFKLVCADCGYESGNDELNHNDLNEAENLDNMLYISLDEIIKYANSYVAEKTGATTDIQKKSDSQFVIFLQGNDENYDKFMEIHNEANK